MWIWSVMVFFVFFALVGVLSEERRNTDPVVMVCYSIAVLPLALGLWLFVLFCLMLSLLSCVLRSKPWEFDF